jgi:acyl-CoA synthetase (AMP-forming)/AMP-acid ligase II
MKTKGYRDRFAVKAVHGFDNRKTSDLKTVVFAKGQEVWTWGRLTSEVNRFARGLIGLGIKQGDRVALHMTNLPEFVVAYLACVQVGAIAAPLNRTLKEADLERLMRRLRPSLYIGGAALYPQVASIDASVLPANRRFVIDGPANDRRAQLWFNLLGDTDVAPIRRSIDIDAPAVLLTTSQPKFVVHSLGTLRKIAQSLAHWGLDINQTAAIAVPMVHASRCFTVLACLSFDAVRPDPHGKITTETVGLDNVSVARFTFGAGAKWSQDLKEDAGTGCCQLPHVAIVLSGTLRVAMDDGSAEDFSKDNVMLLPPGHDAWTIGNERCTLVEFSRGNDYRETLLTPAESTFPRLPVGAAG